MHVLPEYIECSRLVLRCWQSSDVPAMGAAVRASIDHLLPWMPWAANEPLSDSDRHDLVNEWDKSRRAGGDAVYGVFMGGDVVGGTGLHRRAGPETLEIGYWIHVDHVRRGYATELARQLTTTALSLPGITRVEIHHDAQNAGSRRIPESIGFHLDGETNTEPVAQGEAGRAVGWSMTKGSWRG